MLNLNPLQTPVADLIAVLRGGLRSAGPSSGRPLPGRNPTTSQFATNIKLAVAVERSRWSPVKRGATLGMIGPSAPWIRDDALIAPEGRRRLRR